MYLFKTSAAKVICLLFMEFRNMSMNTLEFNSVVRVNMKVGCQMYPFLS